MSHSSDRGQMQAFIATITFMFAFLFLMTFFTVEFAAVWDTVLLYILYGWEWALSGWRLPIVGYGFAIIVFGLIAAATYFTLEYIYKLLSGLRSTSDEPQFDNSYRIK